MHSSALGVFNFETGPNSILSFRAELQDLTASGGAVLLEPRSSQSGIVFLAFSLVIVTQDVSYLEQIVLSSTSLVSGSSLTLYASSSKFAFGNSATEPVSSYFFQWVTWQNSPYSHTQYGASINFNTYSSSSSGEIRFLIYTNNNIYMTGVKVVVILISKAIGSQGTSFFKRSYYTYYSVITNLGVPAQEYGQVSTGRSCIIGLYRIYPYFYASNSYSSRASSSLFSYNSNQ